MEGRAKGMRRKSYRYYKYSYEKVVLLLSFWGYVILVLNLFALCLLSGNLLNLSRRRKGVRVRYVWAWLAWSLNISEPSGMPYTYVLIYPQVTVRGR